MHVLVTGGTGFFGKALLRHWASNASPEMAGAKFTIISRDPQRFVQQHAELLRGLEVTFCRGDILRPDSLPTARSFTHILHAATDSTSGPALAPIDRFNQIVEGTRNILDFAVRLHIDRILLTSSGGIYGGPPPGVDAIPETWSAAPDPLEPQNAYSLGKLMSEHLCSLYHKAYGVQTVVARCFAFIGEDLPLDAHFAVGNFLRDVLEGREILIQGDGSPLRSYLDQRDLAHWLSTLLLHGVPQRAYNVGSDRAVSIAELAQIVSRLAPSTTSVRVMGRKIEGQSASRHAYVPDISRTRAELGLDVTIALEDAISHIFERQRLRRATP